MTSKIKQAPEQRRDFYRIDQDVVFEFKQIDAKIASSGHAELQFQESESLLLLTELKRIDKDNNKVLRLISEENRLLGEYLHGLNTKIDVLARQSFFKGQTSTDKPHEKRVSISEDGIAFNHDRALYRDSYIAVRLMFLPSYIPVTAFAKVVRCVEEKEQHYEIAGQFIRLDETDRQVLSKQILKAQAEIRKTNT